MIRDSIVALLTPMRKDGCIDYDSLDRLVDWHMEQKTSAILVMGTTGEPATLSTIEQNRVIEKVVKRVNKRIPVIAGTGTNSTKGTIDRTRVAKELGVDACLLVTPYYNCPSQKGLYQHYFSVASEIAIPQILYNIPKRTGCDLLPDTVAELAKVDNIIGIKEGRSDRVKAIIGMCKGSDFHVYSGDDHTALETMALGAKGVVSVLANLLPRYMHRLCVAARKRDWCKAEDIDKQIRFLYTDLFVETNPVPVKWLAAQQGLIQAPSVRLPLLTLSEENQVKLAVTVDLLGKLLHRDKS